MSDGCGAWWEVEGRIDGGMGRERTAKRERVCIRVCLALSRGWKFGWLAACAWCGAHTFSLHARACMRGACIATYISYLWLSFCACGWTFSIESVLVRTNLPVCICNWACV